MDLKKIKNFDYLDQETLEKMHTEIHSLFTRVMSGEIATWTISDLYYVHRNIWNALIRAGGKHVSPVDSLDNLELYEQDGKNSDFIKFKKKRSMITRVLARNKVAKTEKTYYYHCAIEGNIYVGKTFNTSLKLNAGEKLEVVFVDLNQYTDPSTKKIWFNFGIPHPLNKSNKTVTTVGSARQLVSETSGQIGIKKIPKVSRADLEEVLVRDSKTGKEIRKVFSKSEQLAEKSVLKSRTRFKLKHDWWKGQFVIKGLPVENWSVKFDLPGFPYFTLNKNPLNVESGITGIKKKGNKSLYNLEGIIPAGKGPNPNKKIPMHIDDLDEGSADIIKDSENEMHINFSGKKLKRVWIFKRSDSASNVWNVSMGELPAKVNLLEKFGSPFSEEDIKNLYFLSENKVGVSEIGRILERPNTTIYEWQKKLNLSNI